MRKKSLLAHLDGKRIRSAFVTKMKNGKTRFEQKRYDAFCSEQRAKYLK